jgi:hypothetical protein
MSGKRMESGTVAVGIVLLMIVALIVLSIVRSFWLDSTNDYYDTLVRAYIWHNPDYEAMDHAKLKGQLLEDGIFIKMHRWDKMSFVKDKELYDEMVKAYTEQVRKRDEESGGVIDALINL